MPRQRTSTQRNHAAADLQQRRRVLAPVNSLDGRGEKAKGGRGRTLDRAASPPVVVSQTKLAIIAVMQQLGGPVSSIELQKIWADHKALEIFEYHLSTLVKAKVVAVAYGPELHFHLVGRA
jgi:hypothetical protein